MIGTIVRYEKPIWWNGPSQFQGDWTVSLEKTCDRLVYFIFCSSLAMKHMPERSVPPSSPAHLTAGSSCEAWQGLVRWLVESHAVRQENQGNALREAQRLA